LIQRFSNAARYDQTVDGSYAWFRALVSLVFGTVGSVGLWSVIVVLPVVETEFGLSRSEATYPFILTMVGFAVGNLLVGQLVDRFGVAGPVALAAVGLGGGYIVAAMAQSLLVFALAQGVLIGLCTAAGFGPLMADISKWFLRRRGVAVAIVASGNYLAGAVWPPIVQAFLDAEGWRATYTGIGIFLLVTLLPLSLLLRRSASGRAARNAQTPQGESYRETGLPPRTLLGLLVIAGLGCCVAMSMPQVHIVAYCVDLGFAAAHGSWMLSLMLAGGVASRLISGWLADRIGGVKTLLLGSTLQCLALFLYIPFDGLASLYAVSIVFGLSQGGIVPSYAMVVREYLPAEMAGRAIGMTMMATVLGMALGGWVSGVIFDVTGSYAMAFLNGIAWNLVNILVMVLILMRSGRPRMAAA